MEFLYQTLAIMGMFSLIVVSHELGHFVAAKVAGVKVKKFSLGFGPSLYRRKVNGTEFVSLFYTAWRICGAARRGHCGVCFR